MSVNENPREIIEVSILEVQRDDDLLTSMTAWDRVDRVEPEAGSVPEVVRVWFVDGSALRYAAEAQVIVRRPVVSVEEDGERLAKLRAWTEAEQARHKAASETIRFNPSWYRGAASAFKQVLAEIDNLAAVSQPVAVPGEPCPECDQRGCAWHGVDQMDARGRKAWDALDDAWEASQAATADAPVMPDWDDFPLTARIAFLAALAVRAPVAVPEDDEVEHTAPHGEWGATESGATFHASYDGEPDDETRAAVQAVAEAAARRIEQEKIAALCKPHVFVGQNDPPCECPRCKPESPAPQPVAVDGGDELRAAAEHLLRSTGNRSCRPGESSTWHVNNEAFQRLRKAVGR